MPIDVIRLAPADCVQIAVTTRSGGHESGRFGFNLATHVDDEPAAVQANRESLAESLSLNRQPVWLDQYHSAEIVEVNHTTIDVLRADGSVTVERGLPLAILTADCLPIVLWSQKQVCVLHAGWRGLAAGIIEAGIAKFNGVSAWIGPGIGPEHYEVDDSVRKHFPDSQAFQATRPGHYQFDLQREAERQLRDCGVSHVQRLIASTAADERFYSHRAEGPTGRFATIAWLV